VFTDFQGRLVAQVADFGYSCLAAKETDLVMLPDPGIWAAPEWHDRPMSLAHAKKADIYSCGLLFVFILFSGLTAENEIDGLHDPHNQLLWVLRCGTNDSTRARMWEWKKADGIFPAVKTAVSLVLGLDQGKRSSLEGFFHDALAFKPDTRLFETQKLVSLTSHYTVQDPLSKDGLNLDPKSLFSGKSSRMFKV
jgi:hypothetical protein